MFFFFLFFFFFFSSISSLIIPSSPSLSPLIVRAARGEKVERTPVWMMRQAGRHMKVYRDLCQKYPTFRQRSEIVEAATEISLQPWYSYGVDGCILFSDILTPLPAMGINFDISDKMGPILKPIDSESNLDYVKTINPDKDLNYIGKILSNIKSTIKDSNTGLLGFIGAPFTLATYLIEGKSSTEYKKTKLLLHSNPKFVHQLLDKLANNLADYAMYQIENGADIIQLFDSWAAILSSKDYDEFAHKYQKIIVDKIKKVYPNIPIILYIYRSGSIIEKMATTGVDVVSLDWTVNLKEGKRRINEGLKLHNNNKIVSVQGNLDPFLLYASEDVIKKETEEILKEGGGKGHIMNLGHGIDANTPEEKAKFFVDTVKNFKHN